jgi:hypothetical protein
MGQGKEDSFSIQTVLGNVRFVRKKKGCLARNGLNGERKDNYGSIIG